MKPEFDMHVHTNKSCDGRGTLLEYVDYAKKIGLKGFAITDHGIETNRGQEAVKDIISGFEVLPDYIEGIRIFKGYEANIKNDGTLDLYGNLADYVEWLGIGFHTNFKSVSKEINTSILLHVLDNNPKVKVLHHPLDSDFPLDFERILDKVEEVGCAIEINASVGKRARHEVLPKYKLLIKEVYERGLPLILSSDAHFVYSLGDFEVGLNTLKELNIPLSYLTNYNEESLNNFINKHI